MYGLIALGYSMVYGVLGFINFAHGEVFMLGAFSGFITSNKLFEAGAWEANFVLSLFLVVMVVGHRLHCHGGDHGAGRLPTTP